MKVESINWKFLANLKKTYGQRNFTTKQAEELYLHDHALGCNDRWEYVGPKASEQQHVCNPEAPECETHWRKRTNEEIRKEINPHRTDTYWQRMSARNTLVAAVQHGQLGRKRKGIYSFNPRSFMFRKECGHTPKHSVQEDCDHC